MSDLVHLVVKAFPVDIVMTLFSDLDLAGLKDPDFISV